ncbi:MAG: WD40 repeat domain-containing protein [Alistipes sp.]|nr:WD40 repeat domain-containing protein [Alistipes sp.]
MTLAVWSQRNAKKSSIAIYDLWKADALLHNLKIDYVPTAICYAPNARSFSAASEDGHLHVYETRRYTEIRTFDLPFKAAHLAISSNDFFFATANGNLLNVYNFETGKLRKTIPIASEVNHIAFSPDNATFAVLTNDGLLTLYDTRTFLPVHEFDSMGVARSCDLHVDGKYIAVVSGENRITLLNKLDKSDFRHIECVDEGITDVRFIKGENNEVFLLYNTRNALVYVLLNDLQPNFNQLLNDELSEKMNAWMKQMPGESLTEYQARVNDETRMTQMSLFETEIATRMADNLLDASTVTLGDFNMSTNTLALNFDTMPTIYLDVPQAEVGLFSTDDLEFRNAQYGLMKDDHFELVYVDVYNKRTQGTYTFDNRERKSLDYLKSDDRFVPLELVQRSSMEEMKLKEIRQNVLEEAKMQNILSDHTQISVKTAIVPAVDADGLKIMNYEIGFSYNVEKGFSAQEDFAPGKYHTDRSGAASSMVEIIKKAFEGEFAQYVKAGKKVKVIVTGMADNLPITGCIPYDGAYGEFVNEPVYGEDLYALTVTKASGVTQNNQLAFLRGVGVKHCVAREVAELERMDVDYEYHVKLLDKAGGEYRRISIDFMFIDAF